MAAARVSGIPHAFVVDAEGIVRYHGHPAAPEFEQAVKKVPAQQYHKLTPSQAAACMLSHSISSDWLYTCLATLPCTSIMLPDS